VAVAGALAAIRSLRCSVFRRRGRLAAAGADGHAGAALLAAAGADARGDAAALLAARRIAVCLDTGDVAGAERLVRGSTATSRTAPARWPCGTRAGGCTPRPGASVRVWPTCSSCGERLAARGADRPLGLPWRSAAAAVLAATGAPEAAARLVAAEVAANRRAGTAVGAGPFSCGSRAPSWTDRTVRRRWTRRSGCWPAQPRRFEYAQALVDFGLRLNSARRRPQARRVLREGIDLAEQMRIAGLAERARAGYTAAGGKPRPPTPSR
jgi:hypothetical protein